MPEPEIKNKYPLIIIGAGPAGLTASIYASRYKIKNLIISESLGGLAFEAHKVCNFPTEQEISGVELVSKMQKHAESLGVSLVRDKVININRKSGLFEIVTQNKKVFLSEAILLTVGTKRRRLNLPDEDKLLGKGISYCATCDAMFYKNKTVAVVGGANSAHTASLYLAEIADKVYQIYRKDKLRGELAWIEQIENNSKIEIIFNNKVKGLIGENCLEAIILDNPYKGESQLSIDGLFVEIGTVSQGSLSNKLDLETNDQGYIEVNVDQTTNQLGVWAAGDATTASNNFHQIITACSEGAIATENIFKFLATKNK